MGDQSKWDRLRAETYKRHYEALARAIQSAPVQVAALYDSVTRPAGAHDVVLAQLARISARPGARP